MIVRRLVGAVTLLAGWSLLARDVVAWIDSKVWAPLALGQLWYGLNRASFNLVQTVIQLYVSPFLWDPIIVHLLMCWAFAALIGVGAAILLFAREPAHHHG